MSRKESLLKPTVVLTGICCIIVVALAFTYKLTDPIIIQRNIDSANAARAQVLPQGSTFKEITGIDMPEGALDAYKADNGAGYVFTTQSKGFDGMVTVMVGIDTNGKVTGINMFDHNETPGLGTKAGKEDYLRPQYYGKGYEDALRSDKVVGATFTSNAVRNAVALAFETYEVMKGAD